MENKFHVGDVVRVRSDVLYKTAGDLGTLTEWYLCQDEEPNFVITKIDESNPDAPYMLDKFFCESNFSENELMLLASRPCSLPIGTSVRINPNKVLTYAGSLIDWFKLFGNDEDVFKIVCYSDKTGAPYVLDRYMGETPLFEQELIPYNI